MKAILLGLVLLLSLMAIPVSGDTADQARARHTDALMAIDGVVGVGLGDEVVQVFTSKPGVVLPGKVDGVLVRVQMIGEVVALHHRDGHTKGGDDGIKLCEDTKAKHRPACPGISTGHPLITAGTICCRVIKGTDVFALSNNHIYAAQNLASIGDTVLQPGKYDGGTVTNASFGILTASKDIEFCTDDICPDNVIDAAIAQVNSIDLGNVTPAGWVARSETVVPRVNDSVKKFGRTTKETKGKVIAINTTVKVNYGGGRLAKFVNQIIISPGSFSSGGDSGSLVVTHAKGRDKTAVNYPVGLLFAGSSTITVINPIDAVLNEFGVVIDGS